MDDSKRTIGLFGATMVGIGAIVGGGIFVLAGVAFSSSGPSAILAFALNGVVAAVTALSFAEMSSAFPESGGPYSFARRVLSVQAAFGVGWVLWFAYIVAAVLYALGFAHYGSEMIVGIWRALGGVPPRWLSNHACMVVLALAACGFYTFSLTRSASGGGNWATIGKLIVFVILVGGGLWALLRAPQGTVSRGVSPFMPFGSAGLVTAMGFTFIAVQGFDLVSAIAGEVKNPSRTIPISMLLSLGLAMVIYIPLLFVITTVGLSADQSIVQLSRNNPETMFAVAAERYMGRTGFWLVVIAAVLSTLSALQANFLAASRVCERMAKDRTLPRRLAATSGPHHTPVMAILATAAVIGVLLLIVPDLSAAGAAASLIFLLTFALTHAMAYLARKRGGTSATGFVMPWFPWLPAFGGLTCAALVAFQAVATPSAGAITVAWLFIGAILYVTQLANRAEAVDARAESVDPTLAQLRGRSALVLVPIANPNSARGLVALGDLLAQPRVGRVLVLSVIGRAAAEANRPLLLESAQQSLAAALNASINKAHMPEALLTVADNPFPEIIRVANEHQCQSLLLGFAQTPEAKAVERLEELLTKLTCDVVVLRAPSNWTLDQARRILVPIGGRGGQDALRARLLGKLGNDGERRCQFLRVLKPAAMAGHAEIQRQLNEIAGEEFGSNVGAEVIEAEDVFAAITERAHASDLVVLGLQRLGRRQRVFGPLPLHLLRVCSTPILMISRH